MQRLAPPNDSVNAPIADVLAPQWRLDRGVLDRRSDARHFLAASARPAISARPASSTRSIRAPASGCRTRRSNCPPTRRRPRSRCAMSMPIGELQGPFPIRFDPEAALIRDQRKILDMTATSWLSFREFNGLLVYYTHLMSYRCAIREVRVGIDSAVPDKVLKMPACDPARSQRDPARGAALPEACAGDQVGFGRAGLPRRQRVGDQEFSAVSFAGRCCGRHDDRPRVGNSARRAATMRRRNVKQGRRGQRRTNRAAAHRVADYAGTCVHVLAARVRPSFFQFVVPLEQRAQGMPGARCTRGLVCQKLHIGAHEHTGQRKHSDIPCAMALRRTSCSPR